MKFYKVKDRGAPLPGKKEVIRALNDINERIKGLEDVTVSINKKLNTIFEDGQGRLPDEIYQEVDDLLAIIIDVKGYLKGLEDLYYREFDGVDEKTMQDKLLLTHPSQPSEVGLLKKNIKRTFTSLEDGVREVLSEVIEEIKPVIHNKYGQSEANVDQRAYERGMDIVEEIREDYEVLKLKYEMLKESVSIIFPSPDQNK